MITEQSIHSDFDGEDILYRNNFKDRFVALQRHYFFEQHPEVVKRVTGDDPLNDPTEDPYYLGFIASWDGNWEKLEKFKSNYPDLWKEIMDLLDVMMPINKDATEVEELFLEGDESSVNLRKLKELMAQADEGLQAVGIDTSEFWQ